MKARRRKKDRRSALREPGRQAPRPGDRPSERLVRVLRAAALCLCALAATVGALAPDLSFRFWVRLVVAMLFLSAGSLWALAAAVTGRLEARRTGMGAPALLFFAALAASTVMAVCLRSALIQSLVWFSFAVGYLVVSQLARDSNRRALFVVALVACGAAVAVHGMQQRFVTLPEGRARFARQRDTVLREAGVPRDAAQDFEGRIGKNWVMSTFLSPNSLAGFLVLVFPMALGLSLDQWRERRLILGRDHFALNGLALAAALVCLYQTNSKGGWLAFAAAMIFFFIRSEAWLKRRIGRPLALGAATVVVVLVVGQQTRLLPPLKEYSGSFMVRANYWRGAVEIIAQRPLFGVGGGNFPAAYCAVKGGGDEETRLVHNDYLQITVETGVFGLLAYLALWWRFWRFVVKEPAQPVLEKDSEGEGHPGWAAPIVGIAAGTFGLAAFFGLAPGSERGVWLWGWPVALGLWWVGLALLNMRPEARFPLTPSSATMRGAEAGLVGFLVHGLLDYDLFVQGIAQTVAMMAALVVACRLEGGEARDTLRRLGSFGRTALAMGSVAIALGLWWGLGEPAIAARATREGALDPAADMDLSERLKALEAAARLDPLDDRTQAMLAAFYHTKRERAERLERELKAGNQSAYPPGLHWADKPALGDIIRHARRAVELNPARSSHQRRLAKLYLESHRLTGLPDSLKNAYRAMRRAVELFPSRPLLYVELARISELDRKPGGALDLYRKALLLNKEQAHARNRLDDAEQQAIRDRVRALEKELRAHPRQGE